MAEQINLVGNFTDNITPKLKKLDRELKSITKAFTKLGGKIRPVSREMGKLAAASERVAGSMKSQRQDITSTTQALRAYTTASRKATSQQKKMKPARMPRAPRATGGGAGGSGGIGIGGLIGGGVVSGLLTNAIIRGFEVGVQLMMAPFKAFASAFAERMGDEMADIQSAGGMFALDKKAGGTLFGNDFGKARQMQERLNASLARSAAALPGATNDYVKAARGVTDTVMMAFGKNEQAFKEFAVELGGREGATSEEAITKVLSRFTEQTVLLGMGGSKGGMPLTMLMEQLVTQEGVNIQGMKKRYAQLRQNPLLATMLEDAQAEINATGAGTADRMRAVMKALDNALPQQVVNAMRRSMDGLVEATRSAFFDPDTGLLGLSRKMKFMFDGVEVESSLFEELRSIAANLMVPLMELLNFLPQIFDPFKNLMPTLHKFRVRTKVFFDAFEQASNWFEDQAKSIYDEAKLLGNTKEGRKMLGDAQKLKEQAGSRGALSALNAALKEFGMIDAADFESNLVKLKDFSPEGLDFDFSSMAVTMLKQFAASPLVAEFVGTIGEVLGQLTGTIASAVKNLLDSTKKGKTGDKLIDTFVQGFKDGVGEVDVQGIISELMDRIISAAVGFIVNKGLPALFKALEVAVVATWNAGIGGKLLVLGGALLVFGKALAVVTGILTTIQTLGAALGIGGGVATAGGAAAAGGGLAAVGTALVAVVSSPAFIAAMIAALAIAAKATEESREEFLGTGTDTGLAGAAQARTNAVRGEDGELRSLQGNGLAGIMDGLMGELTWVLHDFVKGFGDIFTGLYNIVVGAFTDPAMVTEGINQIFSGLWSLFTMIGHLIIAIGYAVPGLIMGILVVLKNLFMGIIGSIGSLLYMAVGGEAGWGAQLAASVGGFFSRMGQAIADGATAVGQWGAQLGASVSKFFSDMMGQISSAAGAVAGWGAQLGSAISGFFGKLMSAIQNAARQIPFVGQFIPEATPPVTPAASSYNGDTSNKMSLGSAIATENKNKPAGSHLVIANSSETVIPAYKGYSPDQMARPAFGGYGGGSTTVTNNFTINGGGMDPQEIAEQVATIVMTSVEEASYSEIYTS